ncbi:response regulator [Paenibacillus thermotolerans]|uniref:response regulator n=1 Tax=Paenibacillus thermotolerans TaxID=3027807 RepID=UPI002368CDE4|nr:MULTISPECIES: response regulator transcription factor [unclassified Paenibacillus]
MSIQVMLVDDHAIVRSGLTMLINSQDDMKVVAGVGSGEEAFEKAMELRPDVIVMDLNMPGENGLVTTGRIKKEFPQSEILVLTMHDDKEYLFRVFNAGASGYILKSADDMDVMTAIRTVYRGEAYLYPQATKSLIEEYILHVNKGEKSDSYDELTPREKEILSFIVKGYSNKEIAEMLFLSVKTVEVHKSNIVGKLQLKTRSELVQYAIRRGILEIG